eukprot:GILJ01011735.1.p1 GENE.GILJ01011735.1~~GILJ01011735.1.p1  ORF type:complete len:610 (+),score=61.32 GILJ01011735.1:256-1830(+)
MDAIAFVAVPRDQTGSLVRVFFLVSVMAMFREGIAFFLFQKSCGTNAIRRSLMYALIWGCYLLTMALTIFFNHFTEEQYYMAHDISVCLALFCMAAMAYATHRQRARCSLYVYSAFHFLHFLVYICLPGSSWSEQCISVVVNIVYYSASPFVLFYVIRGDSNYWRSVGTSLDPSVAKLRKQSWFAKYTESLLDVPQSTPWIDFGRIQQTSLLGRGGSADVYRGLLDGHSVALKIYTCGELMMESIAELSREIAVLSQLRHPNIVALHGVCVVPPTVMLVEEFCSQGSLYATLKRRQPAIHVKVTMMLDAVRGLAYLHSRNPPVVHGDIKSLNLLIDSHGSIKLADFGESPSSSIANTAPLAARAFRFTINWTAPEVCRNQLPTERSDIYSMGMVLWEIWTGLTPFENCDSKEISRKVLAGIRPDIPEHTPYALKLLLTRCWSADPADRPSAGQLLATLEDVADSGEIRRLDQQCPERDRSSFSGADVDSSLISVPLASTYQSVINAAQNEPLLQNPPASLWKSH